MSPGSQGSLTPGVERSAVFEPGLGLVQGHVASILDVLARRVDQGVAVGRLANFEPALAGASLQPAPAQLLSLGFIGSVPALLRRYSAWGRSQCLTGVGNTALVAPRGTHPIHSDAVSACASAPGATLPLGPIPARWAAASAFFARLRSRRSFTASSRARFACVCCFLAAMRPLLSSSRAAAAGSTTPAAARSRNRLELGGRWRDVRRLRPLRALFSLVLHLRVLSERLVTLADDRAVMHEQVLAAFVRSDEAIPLVGVEPLHGSGRHINTSSVRLRNGQRRRTRAPGTRSPNRPSLAALRTSLRF